MTKVTLPNLNQTGANEWADVQGNDVALQEVVNGGIDNENIAAGAGIVGSKLAENTLERKRLAAASFQTKRVTTPETGGGSNAKVIVTWATEFADAEYTVSLAIEDQVGEAEKSFVVLRIEERTKSKIVVLIKNEAAVSRSGLLHATAWHD